MEIEIIQLIVIVGTLILGYIGVNEWIKHMKEEEQRANGTYKSGELVDGTWTCRECGAFNAPYLKRCGKCFNIKNTNNEK